MKIAYLDVDGILADFERAVLKMYGIIDEETVQRKIAQITSWGAFPQVLPSTGPGWVHEITLRRENFWLDIELYPWSHEVFDLVKSHFDKVVLMTSPGYWEHAPSARVKWIRKHFPHADGFAITKTKELFASPYRTLIDDNADWCENFVSHGGKAFCFPRPWNCENPGDPVAALKEYLCSESNR